MRAALLFVLVNAGGCGGGGDPDDAGPCDANKECPDGYSCLVNLCIREGSLSLNGTCSQSVQCDGYPDVTCGVNPFQCRKVCGALLEPTTTCSLGEYCRNEPNRETSESWQGTCFPSECNDDNDCRSDRVCVPINISASACLVACSYSFTTGMYADNCASSLAEEEYCQAIGVAGQRQLVCLEAIGARQGVGLACHPVDAPCEEGLACVDQVCRQYCTTVPADNCPVNEVCQPVEDGGAPLFSVCVPV